MDTCEVVGSGDIPTNYTILCHPSILLLSGYTNNRTVITGLIGLYLWYSNIWNSIWPIVTFLQFDICNCQYTTCGFVLWNCRWAIGFLLFDLCSLLTSTCFVKIVFFAICFVHLLRTNLLWTISIICNLLVFFLIFLQLSLCKLLFAIIIMRFDFCNFLSFKGSISDQCWLMFDINILSPLIKNTAKPNMSTPHHVYSSNWTCLLGHLLSE